MSHDHKACAMFLSIFILLLAMLSFAYSLFSIACNSYRDGRKAWREANLNQMDV